MTERRMRELKVRAWTGKEMRFPPPLGEWDWEDCEMFAGYNKKPAVLMQSTGLRDKNGVEIYEGDIVSLEGNMTADNSLGVLPNGWIFDEDDKYAVIWGEKFGGWELDIAGCDPENSAEDAKYLNHARGLLVDGNVTVIGNIYENPDLATALMERP